tara:strand:+ start:71 stop:322 length:252 start_codon:yes stop_codon:yes gene_type:complete
VIIILKIIILNSIILNNLYVFKEVMIKFIKFYNIKFQNFNDNDFMKIINKTGLFVFPSGPGLSMIEDSPNYLISLKKADYVFF